MSYEGKNQVFDPKVFLCVQLLKGNLRKPIMFVIYNSFDLSYELKVNHFEERSVK